ncbi:transposase [Nannocystis radixulma]|uniref:transposase n=1 Tax=Nannocystis radixulma TaxID=2995305 RepID=UPI00358DA08D
MRERHVEHVDRSPNAKALAAYAGLVPSVRQSGNANVHGESRELTIFDSSSGDTGGYSCSTDEHRCIHRRRTCCL